MVGPSIVHARVAIVNPVAAAVRITCSPKLNVVAAVGVSVRLSEEAVIVSVPPLAQAAACAEVAVAMLLNRIDADRKTRNGLMSDPPGLIVLALQALSENAHRPLRAPERARR